MTDAAHKPVASPPLSRRGWLGLLALACLLFVAVSRQSLWIDEAFTAGKAIQPTLPAWWHEMVREKGSDLQMPLYMLWMWGCEKIFGGGEWALRAVNLLWFVPGLVAFTRALAARRSLAVAAFLVGLLSPFAWYYLNEARPYALQMGASLFLFATLYHWYHEPDSAPAERNWVWGFVLALIALSGGSLLGVIWMAAALAALPVVLPANRLWQMLRANLLAWLVALASLAVLGFYYLWTLKAGARASAGATTDAKNALFIGYELLGFAGLGPGRLAIRDSGLSVFRAYAPGLALYAVVVAGLLALATRSLLKAEAWKKLFWWGLLTASPAVLILAAGLAMHFRVLGRHCAPLIPVIFFLLALGVTEAWRLGAPGRLLVTVFFALSLASGLSLRFAGRHEKDDYRTAATWANTALAHGQSVWWSASDSGADYYRVPLAAQADAAGKAWWLVNPGPETLAAIPPAALVVASRPDVYDDAGGLAAYLARNHYQPVTNLTAFVIWRHGIP